MRFLSKLFRREKPKVELITVDQIRELKAKMKALGGKREDRPTERHRLKQFLGVESFHQIPKSKADEMLGDWGAFVRQYNGQ